MKIKHFLIIIFLILYGYWMSDLYIFIYKNQIYDPEILEKHFKPLKASMYIVNYIFGIVIIGLYLTCYADYDKINKILNKKINLNPWKSTK